MFSFTTGKYRKLYEMDFMKKAADQQKERAREEAQLILREIEEMDQDHGSDHEGNHHSNNSNNSTSNSKGGKERGERDSAAIKAAREEMQQGGSSVWSGGMALKSTGSMRMKVSGPVSVVGSKQSSSSSSSSSSSGDYMNAPWDETDQDGAFARHQADDNGIDETNPWLSAAALNQGKTRHASSGQQIHKKKGEKVVVNVEVPVTSMPVSSSSSSSAKGVKAGAAGAGGAGAGGGGGGVIGEIDTALTSNQGKNNNNNNKRNNKNQGKDGKNDKTGTIATAAASSSDKRTSEESVPTVPPSKDLNPGDKTGKKGGNNKEERKPLLMQKSQEDLVQLAFAGPDYQSDFDHYKGL